MEIKKNTMNDQVVGLEEKEEMVVLWCKMMRQLSLWLSRKANYKLSQPDPSPVRSADWLTSWINHQQTLPCSFSLPGNSWRPAGSSHWRWTCVGRRRNPGMFPVVGRGSDPPAQCRGRAAGGPPWSRSRCCPCPGCPPWWHPWSQSLSHRDWDFWSTSAPTETMSSSSSTHREYSSAAPASEVKYFLISMFDGIEVKIMS